MMKVLYLDDENQTRWDSFVDSCTNATFFHKAGWRRVIERSFKHKTYYLYAEENGEIQGVLPLGYIKSLLFGNSLISTPFCVYGGVACVSENARKILEEAACNLARDLQVEYLELRNTMPSNSARHKKDLYVTFQKELDKDHDKNLLAIPRKQRAMVRKGMSLGLKSSIDKDIEKFYPIYAESVRNLGTPVFSKKYFETLMDVFRDEIEILTIEHNGKDLSSVISFFFRDEVAPYYGGSITAARDLYANDFMYWEVMRRSVDKGYLRFDYGRSKQGTGSYRFKKHWGFEPTPLHYEVELIKASTVPEVNPLNPKYKYFIAGWKLLPLPISNLIGPLLAKSLG